MQSKLLAVESALKFWRGIILIMTLVMLLISFISDDEMAIIALIICLFALILFQTKTLSSSSYQLFILLQLPFLIFLSGKLLETLYYRPKVQLYFKIGFQMVTVVLFMVILWRHYQKGQSKFGQSQFIRISKIQINKVEQAIIALDSSLIHFLIHKFLHIYLIGDLISSFILSKWLFLQNFSIVQDILRWQLSSFRFQY